jgi:PilZ domain
MEQRRTKRFELELPLSITRSGTARTAWAGTTKNISSTGVLFNAGAPADPGGSIEYIITLNHEGSHPVRIRCIGKVVRTSGPKDGGYELAATLERYEFVRDRAPAVTAKRAAG